MRASLYRANPQERRRRKIASKTLICPGDRITLTTKRQMSSISIIDRALGMIEGVSCGLENKYADTLLDAIEMIDVAVKEITYGK